MNEQTRHELRDVKNTIEWELIRLVDLSSDDDAELRPGELRSLQTVVNKVSDAVSALVKLSQR